MSAVLTSLNGFTLRALATGLSYIVFGIVCVFSFFIGHRKICELPFRMRNFGLRACGRFFSYETHIYEVYL